MRRSNRAPEPSNRGASQVDFNGTAYWMALTAGSATPSAAQVRNASARRRQLLELRSVGSTFVAANVPTAMIVDNLVLGSPYEIYFTVAGSEGYIQVRFVGGRRPRRERDAFLS